MTRTINFTILLVAAVLHIACATLPAQNTTPYPAGWCYGYGPPYNFYQREHIPYYALHPPVYYSRPVPRTYGYSPFAYPPGTMTPDVVDDGPMDVINPHVPQPAARPTSLDRTTGGPQVIANPYASPQRISARPAAP